MFSASRLHTLEQLCLGVQRGHQNTLENYPQFLLMLGLGSIKYPLISSIGGVIYLLGRLAYFHVITDRLAGFVVCTLLSRCRVTPPVNQRNVRTVLSVTLAYSP